MPLRRELLLAIAQSVFLPIALLVGFVLYLTGSRWGVGVPVVAVTALVVYLLRPCQNRDDADAGIGPGLPVRRPPQLPRLRLSSLEIAGIPAYEYEKEDSGDGGGGGGDECAVCLGELQRGEAVKRLPACTHLFHAACIDMWLRSRVTCPVCRSSVDAAPAPAPAGMHAVHAAAAPPAATGVVSQRPD